MYIERDDQQIRFTKSYELKLLPCDKCLHVTKVKESGSTNCSYFVTFQCCKQYTGFQKTTASYSFY
jgi:hypothetical protein